MSFFSRNKSKLQKGKSRQDEIASGLDWSHAKDILSTVASVSKAAGFPPLEGVAEVAKRIVEIVESSKKNKDDCEIIKDDIVRLLTGIQVTIDQEKDWTVNESLSKNIENLKGELQSVQSKLERIGERKTSKKFLHASSDADSIQECKEKIKHYMTIFNIHTNINVLQMVAELMRKQEGIQKDIKSLVQIAQIHDQSEITY
ncbi:hypothetical protein VKT23_012978, partial [Stygiomarasmius scandens]